MSDIWHIHGNLYYATNVDKIQLLSSQEHSLNCECSDCLFTVLSAVQDSRLCLASGDSEEMV